MLFSPRIRLKPLAQLCHRLAIATNAGLDDRKIWSDEAQRGSRSQQEAAGVIRDELAAGNSLSEALPKTGEFFPQLFRDMAAIGETSGQLGRTYRRVAQHYDKTLAARRAFMSRLSWPLMQLGIALFTIGLLIWIMGMISEMNRSPGGQVDVLGFGLVGTTGLVVYLNGLVLVAIVVLLLIEAVRRGALWTRSLQKLLMKVPLLGDAMKTLALARFTWAMQLVLDTSMDLRRAIPLALDATGNEYFAQHGPAVARSIQGGSDLHTTLAMTQAFPTDMLDHISVGEQSGRLAETMQHQAKEYQEKSALAISILAQFAGYAVWAVIAAFIILMIFRLFSFYLGTIQSLL